jgi:glucose dehydrogenase
MRLTTFLILLLCVPLTITAQYGARNGEWPVFGGDGGSTRYSPLDQITRDNVKDLQLAWTFRTDNFSTLALVPANGQVTSDYMLSLAGPRMPSGLPLLKPPYGQIVAFDMNKGEIAWKIANGDTPPNVKNNPALQGVNVPRTGSVSHAGLLVTKTLLFAGEGLTGQPFFRAHDKKTGEILWETKIPAGGTQTGLPMTYLVNGRQYIVFAAAPAPGGGSAAFVAYALPAEARR